MTERDESLKRRWGNKCLCLAIEPNRIAQAMSCTVPSEVCPLDQFRGDLGATAGAGDDWRQGSSTVVSSYLLHRPRQHSNFHPMLLVLAHRVAACRWAYRDV